MKKTSGTQHKLLLLFFFSVYLWLDEEKLLKMTCFVLSDAGKISRDGFEFFVSSSGYPIATGI